MSLNPELDLEDAVQREIARLSDEFRGIFSPQSVDGCARDSMARLADAHLKKYVPAFVYRFTRERLKAVAEVRGAIVRERPSVLFVCLRNAGRSQVAAALAHDLSGGKVEVHSAGSDPAERLHPAVVEVMKELGLDASQEFPKPLVDEVVRAADVVVTMGCGDACPVIYGKKYHDWSIDDPADQPIGKVRQIHDEIRSHVEQLLVELGVPIER